MHIVISCKAHTCKQNLIDALDDITTIDDPQIGILEKRINSLQIRSLRRALQELLNKRKAELETAASKETPKDKSNTSEEKGYSDNLFDNIKDKTTPTLGGLTAVKSVDENIIKPLENVLNSTLDPNQQYAYAEPPVQAGGNPEETTTPEGDAEPPVQADGNPEETTTPEGDTEPPVQAGGNPEETTTPEGDAEPPVQADGNPEETTTPEGDTEPPVQSGGNPEETTTPEGNENAGNQNGTENTKETHVNQQNENPSNSSESNPPVNEKPKAPAQEVPSPTITTESQNQNISTPTPETPTPSTNSADGNTPSKQNTPPSNSVNNNSNVQEQVSQTPPENNTNEPNLTEKDAVDQIETKKQDDKAVQKNTQEEHDISPAKKMEITIKIQDAKSDEEISAALLDLREIGRFKGRKNLRKLLKAKRKHNKELAENDTKKAEKYQERIDKYQEKVNENIDQINKAYRNKKFEA